MDLASHMILIFAALMAVKGGSHWHIPGLKKLDHGVPGFFIDGTRLSSILAGIVIALETDWQTGVCFALAWFIGNASSMGEEAGAVGRWGHSWGPYLKWLPETQFLIVPEKLIVWARAKTGYKLPSVLLSYQEGQSYGWKKCAMRGVWLGAALTLATSDTDFIIAGLLMPIAYFAGQTLFYRIHKTDSWAYAEPIFGSIVGMAASQ